MRQKRDDAIQSDLKGGLNLNSTPLGMELNESPDLLNVDLLTSGGIEKRKGSRILYRDRYGRYGVNATVLNTPRRNAFIVSKEGTSIVVYHGQDTLTPVVTKAGVFRSAVLKEKPSVLSYNDGYSRVLFLTSTNAPTQVTAIELANPTITSSLVFSNATGFNGVSSSSIVLLKNGVLQSGYSISYSGVGNTVTVTGLTTDSTATYFLIAFTWQWWAESLQYFGDAFFKAAQRNNSVATSDVNVAVPSSLRTDLDLSNVSNPSYPIRAYSAASFGSAYTLVANGTSPSGASQYAFSDGTPFNSGNIVSPSPFFITFGAVTGTTPISIYMTRRRTISFRGNTGQTGANIKVYINSVLVPQSTSGAATASYGSYYLYDTSNNPILNTSNSATFISFESSTTIGMGAINTVEISNSQTSWCGVSATSDRWFVSNNVDGTFVPRAGFGTFADYLNGRFPTFGVVHKERLALGGMSHLPLTVIFSALSDTRTPGEDYSFYQVTTEYTLSSDPFDIKLDGEGDEMCVAGATWQDSLFIFTNKRTYRVGTGNTTVLSSSTRVISLMEQVGALNSSCVISTSNGIYFLSRDGVYGVTQQSNVAGQYNVETQSLKIRPAFDVLREDTTYFKTAWLSYSETTKRMYLGIGERNLPRDYSHRVYVYGLETGAWTEYYTPGYFRTYASFIYNGRLLFLTSSQSSEVNDPSTFVILYLNAETYIDWVDYANSTVMGEPFYPFAPLPGVTHVTRSTLREYATKGSRTSQLNGFDLLPLVDVEDAVVVLNNVPLQFKVDWMKLSNGNVWLINAPLDNQTLKIFYKGVL